MLKRTFIHIRGIGAKSEKELWSHGAMSWRDVVRMHDKGRLPVRWGRILPYVRRSDRALREQDSAYFHDRLPSAERWRMYDNFVDHAGYVDIETTGLSRDDDEITVIGLYVGKQFRAFVRGRNLKDFPRAVANLRLLVSFGGAQFDIPFLKKAFPTFLPPAHVDLRFPLQRLGFRGRLKQIEPLFGIRRPARIRGMVGWDARLLWERHQRGDPRALHDLIEYTRHDVTNLVPLANATCELMRTELGF